jgi:hypothetical protein
MIHPPKWVLLAAALLVAPMLAGAADETKKAPSQHERMSHCSKDAHAKALKGEERRKFMSECLSAGKHTKAAQAPKASA